MSALASTSLACCHAAHACWEDRLPVLHTPHNTCVLSSPTLLEAARAWTRKLPILTHFSNLAPEGRSTSTPPSPVAYHVCAQCCWRPLSRTKCPDGFAERGGSKRASGVFLLAPLSSLHIFMPGSIIPHIPRFLPLSVDHSLAARSTLSHIRTERGRARQRMILHGLSSKERRGEPPAVSLALGM